MESIKQLQLIGLNNYLNEFCRIYENKIFPNKILLSGKKGIGKSVLSYHFINFVLSQNEKNKYDITNNKINENNKSYNLINNNVHPNFFLIKKKSEKKKIEISQIRELRNFVNKSSFNNILRIILIDDVEYLSNDASNSLLKLIEEPNSNMKHDQESQWQDEGPVEENVKLDQNSVSFDSVPLANLIHRHSILSGNFIQIIPSFYLMKQCTWLKSHITRSGFSNHQ